MISIVMPVFNAQETLAEAIESVLCSGVCEQEIILVDDGSTDGSWDLMRHYQTRHREINLHKMPRNRGGGAARNAGVRLARYPYIFILDSDDVLIKGTLPRALQQMQEQGLDGLAAGKSIFFTQSTDVHVRESSYAEGQSNFSDLISHCPNPIVGNLLYTRAAFEKVGGYPEHHGFDTQGFGFRLLANNINIHTAAFPFYYQRLPSKPSYYIREARAGNLNRNWFYIFVECLYKFSPQVRADILSFPCADARQLARGNNLFNVLANRAEAENIFCPEGLAMNQDEAYSLYDQASFPELQVWCALMDLRLGNTAKALARLDQMSGVGGSWRAIYVILTAWWGAKLAKGQLEDFQYFFGREKSLRWKLGFNGQRVLNRIGRMLKVHQ